MKTPFLFLTLLIGLTAMLNAQPAKPSAGLRIEIDAFSGRPNPVFTVTNPAQIEEILALANSFPRPTAAKSASRPTGLGYRGLIITRVPTDTSDVQTITVYRSSVDIKRKPAAAKSGDAGATSETSDARVDAAAALETRLLSLAVSQGAIEPRLLGFINSK